ncbi:MAG: RecB family exonuclease [Jatrophihabitantaceae bacterium]
MAEPTAPRALRPARLFACTPSRLAAFDCPRRYWFTYVRRPAAQKGLPWAHNSLGAAAHLALARWWSLARVARTPAAGALLVERNWDSSGFRDDTQAARHRAQAARWVRQYLIGQDPDREPAGVERTVGVPAGRLALSGRVDRIDERDAELVVVDYKTGRNEPSEHDARGSLALALYVLGTRRTLRRACRRVELHHLPSGRVTAFEHTEASLARHLARAEATAQDIVTAVDTLESGASPDEVFAPAPGPGCAWCDFRAHCPDGQAVSDELDPWAGLAGE